MINVITGAPCAGKTTHVDLNAAAGDVRIDLDRIATTLGSADPYHSTGAVRAAALAARTAAIDVVLAGVDSDAWIIHTAPTDEHLERYLAAGAVVTVLDPGEDICLARAAADGRPAGTDEAIVAWYAKHTTTDPGTPEGEKSMQKNQPGPGIRAPKYKTGTTLVKDVAVKVESTSEDGIVECIVSVFGNVDSYGDVVMPGAYTDDLAQWAAKGDPIPYIWAHDWHDPFSHIGEVLEAKETDRGLWIKARLDIAHNEKAAQVYRLLKGRRVTQFSFAYDVLDAGWAERIDMETGKQYEVYELRKLHVLEVGPCLIGANRETELLSAKLDQALREAKDGTLDPEIRAKFDEIVAALKTSPAPEPGDTAPQDGQQDAKAAGADDSSHAAPEPASNAEPPASSRKGIAIATALISTLED